MSAGSEMCVWRIKRQDPGEGGVFLPRLTVCSGLGHLYRDKKTLGECGSRLPRVLFSSVLIPVYLFP